MTAPLPYSVYHHPSRIFLKAGLQPLSDSIRFFVTDNLKLKHYNLIFNQVVTLDSYYKTSVIDATLNFNSKSSNSTIRNLNFDLVGNTAFNLNFARNITIENVNINLILINKLN